MSVFTVGALVTARGRDWVVLPGGTSQCVLVRPLGGGEADEAAVLPAFERVVPATFAPPSPSDLGDFRSARLLREALRVGFRSSGGPFRCLAGLAVAPRPYQLVPLLLALRQETVRLLIADDVGVGKTIEAGLVAAELLAQGTVKRLAVLCPPSLATQWRDELRDKFGLDAELVLSSTVRRLERGLTGDESVFSRHPITVVSSDFIKSESKRHEFLRAAPELVIVDEAHGSVNDDAGRGTGARTRRYEVVRRLADDPTRHMVFVTATPHSGNEGAFRNLIAMLDERLASADLSQEAGRRLLAEHFVQRRRADIRAYLEHDTKFPRDRQVVERAYAMSEPHRAMLDDVMAYVRGQVSDRSGSVMQQRIRWWSALSLLRAFSSSPAAAAATLRTRSAAQEAETSGMVDQLGRSSVLDVAEDDGLDGADVVPGARHVDDDGRTLESLARRAQALEDEPAQDAKLVSLVREIKRLLKDGYHPIVFCRFIPTAHYVADALRRELRRVEVAAVTGELDADERAERVRLLAEAAGDAPKVLVATDCLSEGVNLQRDFQAVVHYDLAWNPTRHEQREGRVDRFGQTSDVVRALLLYGEDNGIDGIILEVLLRKHEAIRKDLGVSVAVPPQSDQVLAALLEGVLLRGDRGEQMTLAFESTPEASALEEAWRSTAEAERRSATRFAHAAIHPDEVAQVVEEAREALGGASDVEAFVRTALTECGAQLRDDDGTGFTSDLSGVPAGLREALGAAGAVRWAVDHPVPKGAALLHRTDPLVTALARFVLDGALDPQLPSSSRPARRAGMVQVEGVSALTTLLLLRVRVHLTLPGSAATQVAEEARVVAFTGSPSSPTWLPPDEVATLMARRPSGNVSRETTESMMTTVLGALPSLGDVLAATGDDVAQELRAAHESARRAARGERAGRLGLRGLDVRPQLPVDVLGVYVYRPGQGGQA